ncbi:MAG: hypothetical protein F6K11_35485, partial [Leptolyngbya sp. SIO3F4]|nr:hypothetical protein [Leptolyngbya sp. SIO3F4]
MMTQDEELLHLYQETSSTRLQKLQMGLLQLEQEPHSQAVLTDLCHELDDLKDDANSIGLETIVTVAQELGLVLNALKKHQIKFTLDINDCLCQGIYVIDQLVYETV